MHAQDTPHPQKTEYRGADWDRITRRWTAPPGRSGARSAPPAAGSGPRLGSSTHFVSYEAAVREYPGPSYLVVCKGYGENGGKVVMRTVHERPKSRNAGGEIDPTVAESVIVVPKEEKEKKEKKSRFDADPFHVKKSAWRARASIEDWIRMSCQAKNDYRLCTGSVRGGFETKAAAFKVLERFRRDLEKHHPGLKALAVPELHLGGGANHLRYHLHFMLVFQPGQRPIYSIFHRMWAKALGGTGNEKGADALGNFDFARTHARDGTRFTACQAARYLSKYLTKDVFSGNVGEKRFTTSHGACDPVKRYWWAPIALSYDMTRAHLVTQLREFFPADGFMILSKTFHDGGDTYHVFSAEPAPRVQSLD